jgi:small conductance mechanosensitive channel
MSEQSTQSGVTGFLKSHSKEFAEHAGEYGYLVADALVYILIGLLLVYVLQRLANRYLYPLVGNTRLLLVCFGTLYTLVLAVVILMVLKRLGFDTSTLGPIAVLLLLILGVMMYFVIPFLPRLPFMPGHVIVTNGEMGVVDTISSFHTTLRKFDGTLVYLPNPGVVATKILNYSQTPNRRIEMELSVAVDGNLEAAKQSILALAGGHELVLDDPAPAVFATGANASGINMMLYCWVENDHFLGARSELWMQLVARCRDSDDLSLALPRQEVQLREAR